MNQAQDYRRLAASCREYAARSAIPAHAGALLEAAVIYEKRAAEVEADGVQDAEPIVLPVEGRRETARRV
jgi:hypothetical protein